MTLQRSQPRHSVRPSLLLDFANGKTLDPRIDFTRASTASFYDGETYAKAEENLFEYSQEFDNAYWSKFNANVTANTETAPDGTTTADSFIENASSGVHSANSTTLAQIGITYTVSVFAKSASGTRNLGFRGFGKGGAGQHPVFNLTTGAVTQNGTEWTNQSIVDVGNGWYRCSASVTSSTTVGAIFHLMAGTTQIYIGDGTSSIYLWGAQLEQRDSLTAYTPTTDQPITNYIPVLQTAQNNQARFDHDPVTEESLGLLIEEQRTNLLTYSAEFDDSYWQKNNSSITADTIVAPDGTLTGDALIGDSGSSFPSVNTTSISLPKDGTYTASVFIKSAGHDFAFLQLNAFSGNNCRCYVDLTTGETRLANNGNGVAVVDSNKAEDVGNGWFRLSFTGTPDTTNSANGFQFGVTLAESLVSSSYTGDGYSGAYLWGAQLEQGSFPTSYIPTSGSTATRNADSAEMTGTNFSSWYRQDEGTVYVEARCPIGSSGPQSINRFVSLNDGSTSNRIESDTGTSDDAVFRIRASGGASANPSISSGFTDFQPRKLAMAIQVNNYTFAANAETTSVTSALVSVVDRLMIGQSLATNSSFLNGTIQKLAYYPQRLTNEELQRLTEA